MHSLKHFDMIHRIAGEKAATLVASALVTTLSRIERLRPVAHAAERWLLITGGSLPCEHCHAIVIGAKRRNFHDTCWKRFLNELAEELCTLEPASRSQLLDQPERQQRKQAF